MQSIVMISFLAFTYISLVATGKWVRMPQIDFLAGGVGGGELDFRNRNGIASPGAGGCGCGH